MTYTFNIENIKMKHFFKLISFAAVLSVFLFAGSAVADEGVLNKSFVYVTDFEKPFSFDSIKDDLSYINNQNSDSFIVTYSISNISQNSEIIELIKQKNDTVWMVDFKNEYNFQKINDMIRSGEIVDPIIVFKRNENHSVSAFIENFNEKYTEGMESTVSKYWSRHPHNLKNIILWVSNVYYGDATSVFEDPIDISDIKNRTEILLVVTPNMVSLEKAKEILHDYGIDIRFANKTALQGAAANADMRNDVISEINNFSGDILLQVVAPIAADAYEPYVSKCPGRGITTIVSNGFDFVNKASTKVTLPNEAEDKDNKIRASADYWKNVIPDNLVRMFIYMSFTGDDRTDLEFLVKPSIEVPDMLIYHPKAPSLLSGDDEFPNAFNSRSEYNRWYTNYKRENGLDNNGIWIAVSSYRRDYEESKLETENMIAEKLESEGYNVIIFNNAFSIKNIDAFFDKDDPDKKVDVFLSFQSFGYSQPMVKYGVPVLNGVLLSKYESREEWESDPNGLKKSSFYYMIDQPESNGVIVSVGTELNMTDSEMKPYPIEDRVDRLIGQAKGYANLAHKVNSDKRIAILYFNHPPGKQNIGASYLNLFSSLESILSALKQEGYAVSEMSEETIQKTILTGGRNVGGWAPGELEKLVSEGQKEGSIVLLPVKTYESWVSNMTISEKKIIDEITEKWGAPGESDFMTITHNNERYFVFPVIKNSDNVIMAPEPARGWEEDVERLYHDMNIPVPHQYAAFYLWLGKSAEEGGFGADALIHMGRHGTQEFLPGKMVCMDASSSADMMIGNVPNIYPYIIDGSGEGLQAKRRGYATLISHLTPPISRSGLYSTLNEINAAMVNYERSVSGGNSQSAQAYKKEIISILKNTTLLNDIGIDISDVESGKVDFEDMIDRVSEYIETVCEQTMPYGTHVFGASLSQSEVEMFVESVYIDSVSASVQNILDLRGDTLENKSLIYEKTRKSIEKMARCIYERKSADEYVEALVDEGVFSKINDTDIENISWFYTGAFEMIEKMNGIYETEGLLRALEGKYISPSPQGDPVRDQSVLPMGRNYVGFVSNRVPTQVADEIGSKMADELLVSYYKQNGRFPEKIGIVLWSVETFRHNGVMESMLLHLMGAEPFFNVNSKTGKLTGTVNNTKVNITPPENLYVTIDGEKISRPRVDVVVTMSGLYRDTLPYQIRMVESAVKTISNIESNDSEVLNFVRIHTTDIKSSIMDLPEDKKEEMIKKYKKYDPEYTGTIEDFEDLASLFSSIRVFGPPPDGYGTGIEKEIESGQDWNKSNASEKISDLYVFRMANMYTVKSDGDLLYLGNFEDIFEMNLKGIDIVTNSRSSNLYGVLDNDDFFQYVGGLSIAVQNLSPDKIPPQTYVVNLRNPQHEKIQSLNDFLKLELRSRIMNEKYIEGMIKSGYSGMKELSEIADNLWGWQVTTPHSIENYMWDDLYRTFVQSNITSDAFKSSNPYAYQSLIARMIDANMKDYWDADQSFINNLVNELARSVQSSGIACCHHTCGNPTLAEHISGLLSVPGVCEKDVADAWRQEYESSTQKDLKNPIKDSAGSSGSSFGEAKVVPLDESSKFISPSSPPLTEKPTEGAKLQTEIPKDNQTAGVGKDADTAGQKVSGYQLITKTVSSTTESIFEFLKNPTFSATSVVFILIVILIVGAVFYGSLRKKI